MGETVEELRYDIDQRRRHMESTLDAIGDRVSPARMADRGKEEIRQRVTGWKDRVTQSPGNQMAAGLMAFGAGLLVASMLPSTEAEQQTVGRMQPQLESAVSATADAGRDVAQAARESASEAGSELKGTAEDAAHQVTDETKQKASELRR